MSTTTIQNEPRRWPVAAEAMVAGVILPRADMAITAILVAMVMNSRLVRGGCRAVARKDGDQRADSKNIAKFPGQDPEKPINGAFLRCSQQGKGMSGRPSTVFCGHDTTRHTTTKWPLTAVFLTWIATVRAILYPSDPGNRSQKIAKNRRGR